MLLRLSPMIWFFKNHEYIPIVLFYIILYRSALCLISTMDISTFILQAPYACMCKWSMVSISPLVLILCIASAAERPTAANHSLVFLSLSFYHFHTGNHKKGCLQSHKLRVLESLITVISTCLRSMYFLQEIVFFFQMCYNLQKFMYVSSSIKGFIIS